MNFEGPGNHDGIFRLFDFKISGTNIFRFMQNTCIPKHISEDIGLQKRVFNSHFPTF